MTARPAAAPPHAPIASRRLDLVPLSVEALDALAAGDGPEVERRTGASFPRPLVPPPDMSDHLDGYRAGMRLAHPPPAWRLWLMSSRASGDAVGVIGVTGPVMNGAATLGWSVYPTMQRRGYATEAVRAMIGHLLGQPEIALVRATIAPTNVASLRVAEKAGLAPSGTARAGDGQPMVVVSVSAST